MGSDSTYRPLLEVSEEVHPPTPRFTRTTFLTISVAVATALSCVWSYQHYAIPVASQPVSYAAQEPLQYVTMSKQKVSPSIFGTGVNYTYLAITGKCDSEVVCIQAMSAPCKACKANVTVDEYCSKEPFTPRCPDPLACNNLTVQDFAGQLLTVTQKSSLDYDAVYTYEITIGDRILQKTSDDGDHIIGRHVSYNGMIETYSHGDACWHGPNRSAEVRYKFGPELKLVKAFEYPTCVYHYEVQIPPSKCEETKCCQAKTAPCKACQANVTVDEYCSKEPSTPGCPDPAACDNLTAQDFAGQLLTVTQKSSLGNDAVYTYEITIGDRILQKTSDDGDHIIGRHVSYNGMNETYSHGDACWNGPQRSAEIRYKFGPELKLVKAFEYPTCVYHYEVEIPPSKCQETTVKAGHLLAVP